ncbi:hypothetical protein F4808DRAFT_409961 [Astrocystis sublimbata]|nr:hypothetical protein F4808DRAFT_409961 [Astrocystis sublimbata]
MVALRSRRFLRCFYCGKKSNIQFDAQKSFDCPNCDATNWLDSNGEITDPPAAADAPDRSRLQYAVPRASGARSPTPLATADDSVFCAVCLRNQHMLSSSLAQFEWPDDATSAEHSARERKYRTLKKALEDRYPQVCEQCLPKVNSKLNQASYTAKTDHLRRLMDRTRSERSGGKRTGLLDLVDFLGKLSWNASFALQAVWHVTVVCYLSTESYASAQDGDWIPAALGSFHHMSAFALPYADWLMQWAINLGLCSLLWNPRFKQSIRGFTAHILGFKQWYTYQLLILCVRYIAISIAQYSKTNELQATTQLSLQFFLSLAIIYMFRTAKKAIRTDTTPLFRKPVELTAGSQTKPDSKIARKDPDDLGNILDDILHSPPTTQLSPQHSSPPASGFGSFTHGNEANRSFTISLPSSSFGAMQVSPKQPVVTHYDEEMDWSPSASQHRAFSSYNPYRVKNTNPRFGDAPIEPKSGPIWYKVPPAPTNPAQRLRNPPMRPLIRESPKEKQESFFQSTGRQPLNFGSRSPENAGALNMAPPRFHAPQPKDDPRDGLSSMFMSSFSISPSPEEQEARARSSKATMDLQNASGAVLNHTIARTWELIALFVALFFWIFAFDSEEHYGRSIALASTMVCLMVSIRLAADLQLDSQARGGTQSLLLTNLAVVQIVVAIILMGVLWSGSALSASSGVFGNTLFGGMIAHHMWHIFA